MTLPFDKITVFNFPYYVKTFFPELFNLVYGGNFKIEYFTKTNNLDVHKMSSQDIHILTKRVDYINALSNFRIYVMSIVEYNKGDHYIDDTELLKHMIKNRHLEDYWVQSTFLKQL